jgi:HEXXH motif-containing protein
MRLQLADSLAYLHEKLTSDGKETIPGFEDLIRDMRGGAVYPPSTFGLYYEISNALLASRREEALTLLRELTSERPPPSGKTEILALRDLGRHSARYQRLMDTDPGQPFRIVSASPSSIEAFRQRFKRVYERLMPTVPALAAEIEGLVRQILVVEPAPGSDNSFAGGSCYMLWGALFLNPQSCPDDVGTLESLAHEAAHSLLFGFTVDEPLVLNDPEELYSSPLRDDPRPMDGIFHAAYVSARMHWTMSEVLKSGVLEPQEADKARQARAADRQSYLQGYAMVQRHGKLSDPGKDIIAGAHRYMTQTAAELL